MIKKLLIPLFTLGTLALSASQVRAASFVLDSFNYPINNTSQLVRVGSTQPTASSTKTGLLEVLGGSRSMSATLGSIPPITGENPNPQNLLIAATVRVVPIRNNISVPNLKGYFNVDDGPNVITTNILKYDANGAGLNNTIVNGQSLGNWVTGRYSVDLFRVRVSALDLSVGIKFVIQDKNGTKISATRTAKKLSNGTISITTPADYDSSKLALLGIGSNEAVFSITEMLKGCGCVFDLSSVKLAQVEFKGARSADYSVDMIQGLDIPEPSLVIGSAVALGVGFLSTKNSKEDNSEEE